MIGPFLPVTVLAPLSEHIANQLGLHFPQERWNDLDRAVRKSCAECRSGDPLSYASRVLNSRATREELDSLVTHLTVGETYFFRDKKLFQVIETEILPSLPPGEVRIWSAGCASGEEPYSIAMLFTRMFPGRAITIAATDLNAPALRKASEGTYSEWSFRDTPRWIRSKHFSPAGIGQWTLDPSIRRMVRFSQSNLVQGPPSDVIQPVDIIFCRNVLMYFHPQSAKRVAGYLCSSLKDGGWLIVSPAEISNSTFDLFSLVRFGDVAMYRKDAVTQPAPPPFIPRLAPPCPQEMPSPCPAPCPRVMRTPAVLRLARLHANQGNLQEAFRWCEKAVHLAKGDSRVHFLRAAILEEMGSFEEASRSLRRALYLDPNFAIAHFALGNLAKRQGKNQQSMKHFTNTLDLLASCEPDTVLPESGGLTAAVLKDLIARRVHG